MTKRWRESEFVVADYFREHGYPEARAVATGLSGADILGLPGISCEVKARRGFEPKAWLEQAEKRPGLSLVIFRMNGQGPASIESWGSLMRFGTTVELLPK